MSPCSSFLSLKAIIFKNFKYTNHENYKISYEKGTINVFTQQYWTIKWHLTATATSTQLMCNLHFKTTYVPNFGSKTGGQDVLIRLTTLSPSQGPSSMESVLSLDARTTKVLLLTAAHMQQTSRWQHVFITKKMWIPQLNAVSLNEA